MLGFSYLNIEIVRTVWSQAGWSALLHGELGNPHPWSIAGWNTTQPPSETVCDAQVLGYKDTRDRYACKTNNGGLSWLAISFGYWAFLMLTINSRWQRLILKLLHTGCFWWWTEPLIFKPNRWRATCVNHVHLRKCHKDLQSKYLGVVDPSWNVT